MMGVGSLVLGPWRTLCPCLFAPLNPCPFEPLNLCVFAHLGDKNYED